VAVHVHKKVIELLMLAAIPADYQLPKPIRTVDERSLEAILERSDDNRAKEWKLLIQGAESAKQVYRFTDIRQTQLDSTPLPDGSNLFWAPVLGHTNGSQELWHQFLWYKEWLTLLHYDGLITLRPE